MCVVVIVILSALIICALPVASLRLVLHYSAPGRLRQACTTAAACPRPMVQRILCSSVITRPASGPNKDGCCAHSMCIDLISLIDYRYRQTDNYKVVMYFYVFLDAWVHIKNHICDPILNLRSWATCQRFYRTLAPPTAGQVTEDSRDVRREGELLQ